MDFAAVLPVFALLDFFNDISFVIKIMAFSYLLFWLFVTFRESMLLFGASAIIAAYFMFTLPIPTTFLVILFVVFVVMGNQLQMLLLFGIFPIFRFLGVELDPERKDQVQAMKMQEIQKKVEEGNQLSHEEERFLGDQHKKTQQYETRMAQITQRRVAAGGGR